jgi:hypothetical protein
VPGAATGCGAGMLVDFVLDGTVALTECSFAPWAATGNDTGLEVCASAEKSETEWGPSRHAAAPNRRLEMAVMVRTDERRKRFLPEKLPTLRS